MSSNLRNLTDVFRNWRQPKNTVDILCIMGFVLLAIGLLSGTSWLMVAGSLILVVFAPMLFVMQRRERLVDPALEVDPLAFERMGGARRQRATAGAAASGGGVGSVNVMDLLVPGGPWTINDAATALRQEIQRRETLIPPGAERGSHVDLEAAEALRQAILSGATPATWQAQTHADETRIEPGGMYSIEDGTGHYAIVKIVAGAEDVVHLHFFPGLFSARPTISETGEVLGERVAEEREPLEIQNAPVSPTAFARWRPQLIGRQPVTVQELEAMRIWREVQGG